MANSLNLSISEFLSLVEKDSYPYIKLVLGDEVEYKGFSYNMPVKLQRYIVKTFYLDAGTIVFNCNYDEIKRSV